MSQSKEEIFRHAVDCQLSLWDAVFKIDAQMPGDLVGALQQAISLFATGHDNGSEITDDEIKGTLKHLERFKRETTPPQAGTRW